MSVEAPVIDQTGATTGTHALPERLFDQPVNKAVMHQAVVRQLANGRQGTSDTKTRGEVRGGGRKPYAQKGTGRARQGSIRAPHYRGGGVVFGPHPRSYDKAMPRKQRRLALFGALASVAKEGAVRVLSSFELEAPKTKAVATLLSEIKTEGRVLFVLGTHNVVLEKSIRNIPYAAVTLADNLSVYALMLASTVVFTEDALTRMEALWG